ncbi:cyclopropane-fatty-acyl-phospholipid synthase family protein [Streptomyces sp. AK010]|uniref:SAM-dependent methyltransferase n=1 Tax=Streptomyces sp. AK010 TaxID=2723074 RepID=UPI0016158090|nr:class I SAM-dependent methyltransferase [Streptomyces sp. AK010]MBB6421402.1 SAM-dependent methyltransferase [Streptomyces sp. AK010]
MDSMSSGARGAAQIFNSTVAGFAIAAAWETGALDELEEHGSLSLPEFCTRHDLHLPSVDATMTALASVGVVERHGEKVGTGPEFTEVYRGKAFFHWLTVGCGELFSDMAGVSRNANRVGTFYRRNGAAIGYACRDINAQSFDPVFWQAMEELDFDFTSVADLGCGSGGRLAQIARRYPKVRGTGIDIAADALRDAVAEAGTAGLGDRLEFIEGDVMELRPDARLESVEVLTCFMMGHDFWPRENCVASLRRLREVFPGVRRFLLGDTARTEGMADRDKPVFTLAFETAHDLMGVYLPTLGEWEDVFEESGWKCVGVRPVQVPADSVIFELA